MTRVSDVGQPTRLLIVSVQTIIEVQGLMYQYGHGDLVGEMTTPDGTPLVTVNLGSFTLAHPGRLARDV